MTTLGRDQDGSIQLEMVLSKSGFENSTNPDGWMSFCIKRSGGAFKLVNLELTSATKTVSLTTRLFKGTFSIN